MFNVVNYLMELEAYNCTYPEHIWDYFNYGDLLFVSVKSGDDNLDFIVSYQEKDGSEMFKTNFTYCLNDDDFMDDEGFELFSNVERYPYRYEVGCLENNLGYNLYLTK